MTQISLNLFVWVSQKGLFEYTNP